MSRQDFHERQQGLARAKAFDVAYRGVEDYKKAEATKKATSQNLGSEEQMQGYDPKVEAYNKSVDFDEQASMSLMKEKSRTKDTEATKVGVATANDLYKQAYAAAQAGDFAAADALTAQAEAAIANLSIRDATRQFIRTGVASESEAKTRLLSEEGMAVGRLVRDANQLQDKNSQVYQDLFSNLTDPSLRAIEAGEIGANRSLAAERRVTERQLQDASASRGAGRNQVAERALDMRVGEAFGSAKATVALNAGLERAQVLGNAAASLDVYARNFAMNAVSFAEEWVQGGSEVRDSFHQNLQMLSSEMKKGYQESEAYHAQKVAELKEAKAGRYGWVGTALSVVGAVVSVIPGLQIVGAGVMAIGSAVSSAAKDDKSRAASKAGNYEQARMYQRQSEQGYGEAASYGADALSQGWSLYKNRETAVPQTEGTGFLGQGTNLG